ncbi:hypothetical protein PG985_009790 [Apiospora marii]|uniref:uncharacterized protein n=1 Tax=Apiospora marii TaxID=335849 RepID=UPI003130F80E
MSEPKVNTGECLQAVLERAAKSDRPGRLLLYPLGSSTGSPREVTYTSLYEQAKGISQAVRVPAKLRPGRPVLLHFDDHWDTILWFWVVLLAGGLPVLSPPFSNVPEDRRKHVKALSALLESPSCLTRSKFFGSFGEDHDMQLFCIDSLLQYTEKCHCDHRNGDSSSTWTQRRDPVAPSLNHRTIDEEHAEHEEHEVDDTKNGLGDLAVLMLTSGSTGNAKAVQFTHAQVLAAVAGKAGVRPIPPGRPLLNWVGLDHVAGLIEAHLQALWLGIDQVHVSAADVVPSPALFLDLLSRHRVTRTFAPNFFLAKLVSTATAAANDAISWDLSSLTCVTTGGEANDVQTCLAASALFEKYGAAGGNVVMPGFGMTETCAGAIFNTDCPSYDVANQHAVASLGTCMRGIEMRIVTTTSGQVAEPNEPGELEVRGPVVTGGYYRNSAATSNAFTPDGWFRTGDRGLVDSNGRLTLVGRAKDVININGIKMASGDVQSAVEQSLGARVERLIVFPSAAVHTEQVTVAYVPRTFPLQDEEAMDIVRLATRACLMVTATSPLVFALQESSLALLPTSTLGKISRIRMARLFAEGAFDQDVELQKLAIFRASRQDGLVPKTRAVSKAEARLLEDIAVTLETIPDLLDLPADASIFDVGFTSMHVIKLKYYIEKRLGRSISVFQIMKNPTIHSLAADLDDDGPEKMEPGRYDPVVVFHETGSKPPLWLFHPGVGEVLVFVGLARRLAQDDDRPVFALRAAGFEPHQPPFASIEQAVDLYAAAIRRRQPRGPYALAGYSYGGMLAFETAKRLQGGDDDETDTQVSFLGVFNLPPHIKNRISQLSWNVCLLHLTHFLGLVTEDIADASEADPAFRALSRSEALAHTLALCSDDINEDKDARRRLEEELGLDPPALARWADVAYGLQAMAADYDPSGEVRRLDLFHAAPLRAAAPSREAWLGEQLSRWADFAREAPRFHAVGGAHYTMIGPEHVVSFAETLIRALEARGV